MTSGHLPPGPWVSMTTIADWHSSSAWCPQHLQKHACGLGLRYSCSTHIDFTPLDINVDVFNLRRHISVIILHLRALDRQKRTEMEERMLTEFSRKAEPVCRLLTWDDGKIGRKGTNVLKEDMGKHHMRNQAAHYVIFMSSQTSGTA